MKKLILIFTAIAFSLTLTGCFKTVSFESLDGQSEEFVSLIPEGVVGEFEGSFDGLTTNVSGRVVNAVRGEDYIYAETIVMRTDGFSVNANLKLTDYYRGPQEKAALIYAYLQRLEKAKDPIPIVGPIVPDPPEGE
jgi:hypothetical protein